MNKTIKYILMAYFIHGVGLAQAPNPYETNLVGFDVNADPISYRITAPGNASVSGAWLWNQNTKQCDSTTIGFGLSADWTNKVLKVDQNQLPSFSDVLDLQDQIDNISLTPGPTGPNGATGATGLTGATGPQGLAGPQGIQGPAGTNGVNGAQGVKGDKGDKGNTGNTGPQGAAGTNGANGISFTVSGPVSQSFTSGTAFQPRSGGACALNILASLSGALGVNQTVVVAISPTQNGTYTTVASQRLTISLVGLVADADTPTILVPAGYYVRIALGANVTATCIRTDLQ